MPVFCDIIIEEPPEKVWAAIADASTHGHWLSPDFTTRYCDGELVPGGKFVRTHKISGQAYEGEIVVVCRPCFLKVRVDLDPVHFVVSEYHLISVFEGTAVRLSWEVYDTSDEHHMYFPEMAEQNLTTVGRKLKDYCETS